MFSRKETKEYKREDILSLIASFFGNGKEIMESYTNQKYLPCCLASRTFLPVRAFSKASDEQPTLP